MNLQATNEPIYSNHTLLAPNGEILCRIGARKSQWYIDRNLVDIVSTDPMVLRLRFEPKGRGHRDDEYYLSYKEDRCVKCGKTNDLTLHHIVPRCFRRHFPDSIKSHDFHDILPLCVECHNKYELEANKLKHEICQELGVKIQHGGMTEGYRIMGYIYTLEKFRDKIPYARIRLLEERIKLYQEKSVLAGKVIVEGSGYGRKVVELLDNIQEFVVRWRKHFIEVVKPEFMPNSWDINRKIKI